MTIKLEVHSDTLTVEEADALIAFANSMRPGLEAAEAHRKYMRSLYGSVGQNAGAPAPTAPVGDGTELPLAASTDPEPAAPAKRGRKPKEAAPPAPAPETAETQAQDAADEAAEVEQTQGATLTIDDVKASVMKYVQKHSMEAAQEDGPAIFQSALGAPPSGEAYWKMSLVPTDQETLKKVLATWEAAVANKDRWKKAA